MTFDAFVTAERDGWHNRANAYGSHTARATLQIVPAMLDALRLRPGMHLLDVACGPGYVAGVAAALDVRSIGIDYAPGMVEAAKERFAHINFQVADAEALPFGDESFDAVACNMGLFHMGDPAQAMREANRCLRTGGRFAFSQWSAPADSTLYSIIFRAVSDIADLSRAVPAPDAYALSNPDHVSETLTNAGFSETETRRLDTTLIAEGDDFFEFFMTFGVRVPLIVAAQEPEVRTALHKRINADMAPFRTSSGFEVPMPSLLFTGTKS